MVGLQHVILHVGLCSAVAKLSAETTVPLRVQMADRAGGLSVDRTFRFERGEGTETIVEFDVARGVYRLQLDVPKYRCADSDFLDILPDSARTVTETLSDGAPAPSPPVMLLGGTAPISFLYVKPTFVLFDKSVTCNQPVQTPVTSHINVEYDQGAYHAWLYSDATPAASAPLVMALRLRTPTNLAHYVRLPIEFPLPWGGWPSTVTFNVTEDMIAGLATEKVDTLLCPKIWETRIH